MTDTPESVRILYMEDDEGLARLFQKALNRLGYEVDLAPDGEKGLEMYENGSYDILAVDHKMPNRSGLEVIRALVDREPFPPTIMITGAGDEMVAAEAMKLGASEYLIKDVDRNYLELMPHVIGKALEKSRLLRDKLKAEEALKESEKRYRNLFDESPVILREEDWSQAKRFLDELSESGVTDFESYFRERPEALETCRRGIRTLAYNKAALDLSGEDLSASARPTLSGPLFHAQAEDFVMDMVSVANGNTRLKREEVLHTAAGEAAHVIVRWSVPPGYERTFARVLVSMVDVTDIKRMQEELRKARDELERRVRERTAELADANARLQEEISHHKRTAQELQESERLFRTIFESAGDPIFIKDRARRYTLVNPAMTALLDRPASEILGKRDEDLSVETQAGYLKDVDNRVLAGETIEEEHTRRIKGSPTTFLELRVPMRDHNNEIFGVCGIARDVTEYRRLMSGAPRSEAEYPSDAMREALASALLAAKTDTIVMLTGESGSGKDYLARYVHDRSRRSNGPFFSINCAAVAPELAEAELFGHEAGAFTGARGRKRGLLELAEGGTLLLNEIGELSLRLQAKLLTFLDTKTFTRVGGEKSIRVNARLIAATNRNLEAEVAESRFRQDLYFRLNVFSITVPPLRDRAQDMELLVEQLMSRLVREMQLSNPPALGPDVMEELKRYSWPGNVRELRNVLERALILSGGGFVRSEHLGLSEGPPREAAPTVAFSETMSLERVLADVERSMIEEALRRAGGKKQDAADILGISRHALKRHMKKLEMSGS